MPQLRPHSREPSRAVPILFAGLLFAVAAGAVRWPPVPVLWAAVLVAAWSEPAALLTGKRDAAGNPTPAGPGETRALRRSGFWRSLRWRLLVPSRDWLPGWPPLGSFVTAVCAAALAWCFPVAWWPAAPADGLAAFILVCTATAARRRAAGTAAIPGPGVRVTALALLWLRRALGAVTVCAAVLAAVAAGVAVAVVAPTAGDWAPTDRAVAVLAVAGTTACLALAWPLSRVALAEWRTLTAAAGAWQTRWAGLRFDPAPQLTATIVVGGATVDTFRAPPALGSQAFLGLSARIAPSLGPGMRVAVLEMPDTDSTGTPRPGTRHPLLFQVVGWPVDDLPDPADPGTDPAVAALLIRSAMCWTVTANGYGQPMLDGLDRITGGPPPEPAVPQRLPGGSAAPRVTTDTGHPSTGVDAVFDHPGQRKTLHRTRSTLPRRRNSCREDDSTRAFAPSPAAWRSTWAAPEGPSLEAIRPLAGDVARNAGCEVLIDHRQGHLFFGALTDPDAAWDDPGTGELMGRLATEDRWTHIWSQVLKQGANPPTIQHATAVTIGLPGGGALHRVGFVTRMGIDPADYRGLEPKLATALDAAPFVSVTGWPADGAEPGSRHPQAFAVCWSTAPTPTAPHHLSPDSGARGWVLAGRVNAAFDAARLARPELATARCLTAGASPGSIWEITLRLYGGVTLADVRSRAGKIRQTLDAPWLRIAPDDTGCALFAGIRPEEARLADPGADRLRLVALDWDQAWADSGVTGKAGLLPELLDTAPLPRNPAVRVLDFRLPPGVDLPRIRRSLPKLRTATGNDFLQIRSGAGADTLRLLVARDNPLPGMAPFDFAVADDSATDHHRGILFAVGVDGEPIAYDPGLDPHLLLAGLTGAGKSCLAQGLVYGALVRGWQVYVIDPVKAGADYAFARDRCRAFASTAVEATAVLRAVYAEITRRRQLNAAHGVGSTRELPDAPPHLLVLIDEFTSLVGRDPVPPRTDDPELDAERDLIEAANHARIEIGVFAGKIAREARSAGVTLALGTQKLSAKMLDTIPGAGDLKTNLSRVLLGKTSWGDRASALRAPDDAPDLDGDIPRGRGLWETTAHPAQVIQCWCATQAEFRANLEARVPAVPEAERLSLPGKPSASRSTSAEQVPDLVELGDFELSLTDLEDADQPATAQSTPPPDDEFPGHAARTGAVLTRHPVG